MTESDSANDVSFRQPQIVSEVETTFPLTVSSAAGGGAGGGVGAGGGGGAGGGCGGAGGGTRLHSGALELGRRLLLAARAGDTGLVLDLMAKGAPFTNDWLGTSPLHLAASNAHAETCGVLLRAGVSRESRTKVERTPLHLAAYAGHTEVVELLLQHGAQVDCRDMLRMTPLHWAAQGGHLACCAALLRAGADPRALSKFRKTPAQLAHCARQHHPAVRRLLDDELRRREADRSVRAIIADRPVEEITTAAAEPPRPVGVYTNVHRNIQEVKLKPKQVQEKAAKSEIKAEKIEASSGKEGAAAALLRRHGITLLPADDTSTVLNALQSGRTVVLSDAGKLMLKESSQAPRVLLSATPVRSTPRGVKVFTVNNRLATTPTENRPRAKIMTSQDIQQLKIVQLPPDARIVSPRKAPRRLRVAPAPLAPAPAPLAPLAPAPAPTVAPAAPAAPAGPARQPVKIIMNKSNFERLVAGAKLDLPDASAVPAAPATLPVVTVPAPVTQNSAAPGGAETETETEVGSLRAALAASQACVGALRAELRALRARLARLEPPDP